MASLWHKSYKIINSQSRYDKYQSLFYSSNQKLSGIVLKRFVKEHWDQEASETPIYIPPIEDKNAIKSILAQGLSDPDPKLRTAVVISIISIQIDTIGNGYWWYR